MVLGKLPGPGRTTIWMIVGQGPTALTEGADGGCLDGWLVVLGLTALWDSISVYIEPSPKEREKEKRKDR